MIKLVILSDPFSFKLIIVLHEINQFRGGGGGVLPGDHGPQGGRGEAQGGWGRLLPHQGVRHQEGEFRIVLLV